MRSFGISEEYITGDADEYFRRIMCSLIGECVEGGKYPSDFKSLEKIVKGISYQNAKEYFGF